MVLDSLKAAVDISDSSTVAEVKNEIMASSYPISAQEIQG